MKQRFTTFLVCLFVFSGSIFAEYTVGLRNYLGGNAIVGQMGNHFFLGTPPILPLITGTRNSIVGGELFGDIQLTRMLYLEPHIGFMAFRKFAVARGIETNINGKTTFTDDTFVYHRSDNLAFGLSIKGKSPDINRRIRFTAAFGFQFLYAFYSELSSMRLTYIDSNDPTLTDGQIAALEKQQEKNLEKISNVRKVNINPWGLRMLSGVGFELFFPQLRGVIIVSELRVGFDFSYALFQYSSYNSLATQLPINENLKRTYLELSAGLYIGASYRLPIGKDAIASIPVDDEEKFRPRDSTEESD